MSQSGANLSRDYQYQPVMTPGVVLPAQSTDPVGNSGDGHFYVNSGDNKPHFVDKSGVDQVVLTSGSGGSFLPVNVLTTSALAANTYSATALTITFNAVGAQTVNGVTFAAGMRVGAFGEGSSHNGVYDVTVAGDGATKCVLTRSSDANVSADFVRGKVLTVGAEDTTNGGRLYEISNTGAITLDTTTITVAELTDMVTTNTTQTITGAKTFSAQIAQNQATNQIALGATGHVTTIDSVAPAAAPQTIIIPDSGAASDTVALLGKAQTFTGAQTFAAQVTQNQATNQIALGAAAHLTTINSVAPAGAAQTINIPDSGAASDTVALLALAQTLTNKTLTTPVVNVGLTATGAGVVDFSGSTATIKFPTGGAGADLPMASHKLTALSAGAAAGDSLRWEQGGMLVSASNTGAITAATKFMSPPNGAGVNAAQAILGVVSRTGVLRNLNAALGTAPGGADTVAFTVQKSSDQGGTWVDTTLTCTISAAGKTASDTTHTPAVAAGDYLAIKLVSSNVTAAAPAAGFEIL